MGTQARPRQYLTIREAAERLKVSERAIRRRIRDGSLAALRLGPFRSSPVRIDEVELLCWLYSEGSSHREDFPAGAAHHPDSGQWGTTALPTTKHQPPTTIIPVPSVKTVSK